MLAAIGVLKHSFYRFLTFFHIPRGSTGIEGLMFPLWSNTVFKLFLPPSIKRCHSTIVYSCQNAAKKNGGLGTVAVIGGNEKLYQFFAPLPIVRDFCLRGQISICCSRDARISAFDFDK